MKKLYFAFALQRNLAFQASLLQEESEEAGRAFQGNCLIEVKLNPARGHGLGIDVLATLKTLLPCMRTAGKLVFKQKTGVGRFSRYYVSQSIYG